MKTLVIDTNICLDLFVFHDAKVAPLLKALQTKKCQAITNKACQAEWESVLQYKRLNLSEEVIQKAITDYKCYFKLFESDAPTPQNLPQCKDADDQKFLILSAQANAQFLLTKDKALLKLSRYCKNHALFTIISTTHLNLITD